VEGRNQSQQHSNINRNSNSNHCGLLHEIYWQPRNATKPNRIGEGIETISGSSNITNKIKWIDLCGLGFLTEQKSLWCEDN